jgi:hypothetical protein
MNSKQNSEQTDPYDVAIAALKQARQQIGPANKQLPREQPDAARHPSELQKRLAVPPHRSSLGRLALQGLIGLLVAACIGAAAMVLRSHGDAAKQVNARGEPQLYLVSSADAESLVSAQSSPLAVQASASKKVPPEPARPPQAQAALADSAPSALAPPPGQEELLQSMARGFLAVVEQELDELKTSIEQLKTSQEQLVRNNAAIAEVLKTSHEQMVRDNAAVAEQLKASQEQMARLIANASEQQLRPKTSAPQPRPIATPTGKPVPKLQARAKPLAPVRGRPE